MLTYLETHQDLSPASPQVITDSIVIDCTDIAARYKINPDIPHAFLVRTAADITITDSSGNALTKDDDFYLRQTKRDAYYSKEYSLSSIFSEVQFAAVGTYTVTRHLCVGTYICASWLNTIKLAIKDIFATVQGILTTLSSHTTTLDNHATTLSDHNSALSSHDSRITVLESNPTIIVVADHATMLALTSVKTGTTVYVVADTDGKRAEYLYDGTAYQKTSDPDWENINIDWSALLNIPTGVAALIAGTLKSTALADMPTPADADDTKVLSWDKTTGKYKLLPVSAAAGVGDVSSNSAASTAGHIAQFSNASGKIIEDGGLAPSDLYASRCATQSVTTADVTIADNHDGTLILSGALTGNRAVYLPAAIWKKTIICNCTGSYTVRVLATGQTTGGVYLAPGDAADVYCDGVAVVKTPVNADKLSGYSAGNASGNVPVSNGAKCENLVSAASYAGDVDFPNALAWIQSQLIDGTYSARFQYRADWTSMPNADVDNWEFLVVSSEHTGYALGQIRVTAWKINSPGDRATWENRCKDGAWGGWKQLTDANGNAIYSRGVIPRFTFTGVYTFNALAQALLDALGTGSWNYMISGGMWSSNMYFVSRIYYNGTAVYMCASSTADNYVINLTARSESFYFMFSV